MLRLILLALSVAAIAQIPAPNIVGGDVPSGASNLTTVGAIPYVSAAGILNQDAGALFWDATNKRLGIRTTSPGSSLDVASGDLLIRPSGKLASDLIQNYTGGSTPFTVQTGGSQNFIFGTNATERMRLAHTTGNLLIGTTTDSNFKLDVAASGSAGTARFYGGAGVSNSTKVVVQAGGGQSTSLQEWQNSSGAQLALISSVGAVRSDNFVTMNSDNWNVNVGNMSFASTRMVAWSNSSTDSYGTKDLGIYRNAAGVLEVNSGTAGTYRDLILRRSQHSGVTVANLPAAAAGNAGSIQYVTDANATTIGSTVAGGGANKVMVWSDGAAWKIFAN